MRAIADFFVTTPDGQASSAGLITQCWDLDGKSSGALFSDTSMGEES